MAIFGRALSRLRTRQRAAATPIEVQRAAATAAVLPVISRLRAATQAMTGQAITQPIISPRQAVQLVRQTAPSVITSAVPPGGKTQKFSTLPFITASNAPPGHPLYVSPAEKAIAAAAARPSQTGIGPLAPQQQDDNFLQQLFTTGIEKILGPATTPPRPRQPGVAPSGGDRPVPSVAPGMPGWILPAALIAGVMLLRR